jgi:hypothetical protein
MSNKKLNKITFKNIISKGKFELTCSYGMLVIITVAAIAYIMGQFAMILIVTMAGI